MKANIGKIDRIMRVLTALAIIVLNFSKLIDGNTAVVLLIFASAFILSSVAGVCPLYFPLRISTRKSKN